MKTNRNGIQILDRAPGDLLREMAPQLPKSIPPLTPSKPAQLPKYVPPLTPPAPSTVLPPQRPIERHFQISCSWLGCRLPGTYPYGQRHWCGEHLDVVIVRDHRGAVPEYLSTMEVSA